eukprot:756746-Hanusia_phi.AAC.4
MPEVLAWEGENEEAARRSKGRRRREGGTRRKGAAGEDNTALNLEKNLNHLQARHAASDDNNVEAPVVMARPRRYLMC